ncbi:MAG: cyclic nucleotide-binding domain-containing protein [Elusimicrobiales bacterium]|nr:cyclic nucleotide-binding domain-containing protein [Elusimicrobiales bacterium]
MENLLNLFSDDEIKKYFILKNYQENAIIFDEDEDSHTLYIVSDGDVVIEKATNREKTEFKDLAIISRGSFLGEMAVFENSKRTARARALNNVSLFEITKEDFLGLIKSNPEMLARILILIIKTLSSRIAHTSEELTLLYDISKELSEEHRDEKEFISSVIDEISLYFPEWDIEGYYYNPYNEEFEKIKELDDKLNANINPDGYSSSRWIDNRTYIMQIKMKEKIAASLIFISKKELLKNEINDFTTIFNTIFHIVSNGIEKTRNNREAYLLAKLRQKKGEL